MNEILTQEQNFEFWKKAGYNQAKLDLAKKQIHSDVKIKTNTPLFREVCKECGVDIV